MFMNPRPHMKKSPRVAGRNISPQKINFMMNYNEYSMESLKRRRYF